MSRRETATDRCKARRAFGAAALLVVLLGIGCGGEDRTDREQLVATVGELQEALAARDLDEVCAALGPVPRRQLGTIGHDRQPTTCRRDLGDFLLGMERAALVENERAPNLRRLRRPRIVRVRVSGDEAVVATRLDGAPLEIPFVRDGDRWKLADLFVVTGPVRPDLQ